MPLTPKGYCDLKSAKSKFAPVNLAAEMPLTPKGYCDVVLLDREFVGPENRQKCP